MSERISFMIILWFILILIVTFAVMMYFLRPTATETSVKRRLESIEENRAVEGDSTTILREQAMSATPWLDEFLHEIPGSVKLAKLIRQAGQNWQVGSLFLLSFMAIVVVASLSALVIPSIALSVLFGIAAGVSPYLFLFMARERRFRQCDAQVPEAADLMARALRAGHAMPAVLEMVGKEIAEPLASEFRIVHEEQNLGLPLRDAMVHLVDRVPRDDVRFVTTAILLQKETGGNLAVILDKTAALARERARLFGQLRIYTAQGRITGWILCAAPFVMCGVLSAFNWKLERLLFTTPTGLRTVYVGLFMMAVGVLIIRKIIDIKV
jgi:tight adherence protein B